MQIFIDTANIDEIKAVKALGILDGVTTNPSLIAREKNRSNKKFRDIVKEICVELGGFVIDGKTPIPPDLEQFPVSVEVIKEDAEGMIDEGYKLAEIASNVVVKLPCTTEGLKACKTLSASGIATNMTLCFSANQALLVAKAGATYVSPFVGRLDDIGVDGMNLISDIKMIYYNYQLKTKILVASIRNPLHLTIAAKIGADVATIPANVIKQLMSHDLTEKGLAQFLKDCQALNSNKD